MHTYNININIYVYMHTCVCACIKCDENNDKPDSVKSVENVGFKRQLPIHL